MKFNEHQKRIWESMILLIDKYLDTKIAFNHMVSSLEGALDASEIKDQSLIKEWYNAWTPLEIINAETEFKIPNEQKIKTAMEMKRYLISVKNKESNSQQL